jgi:hypothetical protein
MSKSSARLFLVALIVSSASTYVSKSWAAPVASVDLVCKGPSLRVFPEFVILLTNYDTYYIKTVPSKSQFMIRAERSDEAPNSPSSSATDWLTIGYERHVEPGRLDDGTPITKHRNSSVSITSASISMTKNLFSTYDKSNGKLEVVGAGQGPISYDIAVDLTTLTMQAEWKVALGLFDDKGTYTCTGHSSDPRQQQHFDALAAAAAQAKAEAQAKADAERQAQQAEFDRQMHAKIDPIKQACASGQSVKVVNTVPLQNKKIIGRVSIILQDFAMGDQVVRTIPDEQAASFGLCLIEIDQPEGAITGWVPFNDLATVDPPP